jgi:copper(I)-binding protein
MKNFVLALAASATFALPVFAAAPAADPLAVTAPWVRATVPQQKSTGAFMVIKAPGGARLVAVSSPVAGMGELHQMSMQGDMMKMQQVDSIDLPAGKDVNLASGGYHVMLMNLNRQLKEGETVALTLVTEGRDKKRSSITLQVPVKPLGFSPAPAGAAPKHH